MDAVELLKEAKKVGLAVRADGTKLVVSGPRSSEAVAGKLLAHKAAVLAALAMPEEWRPVVRWATWLAEHKPEDEVEVRFQEAPLRTVALRLSDVGRYVTDRLASLSLLCSWEASGVSDRRPGWRAERINELCGSLSALREALRPLGLAEPGDEPG